VLCTPTPRVGIRLQIGVLVIALAPALPPQTREPLDRYTGLKMLSAALWIEEDLRGQLLYIALARFVHRPQARCSLRQK